jgi:hypothetical protein
MDAELIITRLGLAPHPEGGWYVETHRSPAGPGTRAACTAIYYLLRRGERSAWHRVDAEEVWLWHGGGPLVLDIAAGGSVTRHRLGPDLVAGERPQAVVPAQAWQAARPVGAWTLVSCVVAPGFELAGFTLAAPGWTPPGAAPAEA